MKTKPPIIVLAVLALAGWFAVRATWEVDRTRAAIRALASQDMGLRTAIAAEEKRWRTANDALVQLEQKISRLSKGPGAGGGASATASSNDPAAKPATRARQFRPTTIIMNDPQKAAEYAKSFRISVNLDLDRIAKELGLSAEQAGKLADLRVWAQQRLLDLSAVADAQGLSSNDGATKKLHSEDLKVWRAKEAEVLGDLNGPYQEYRKDTSNFVRGLAKELAGTAIYSGEPVTSAQIERTWPVLAANSQWNQTGSVTQGTVNWPAASAQLQGVLSPSQITTLGNIIQRNAAQAKVDELTKRLTAEFNARLPSP